MSLLLTPDEKRRIKSRQYYIEHRFELLENQYKRQHIRSANEKKRLDANPGLKKKYNTRYYQNHFDEIAEKKKQHHIENREKLNEQARINYQKRKKRVNTKNVEEAAPASLPIEDFTIDTFEPPIKLLVIPITDEFEKEIQF